jgi:type II secretory pathway pseudopilin PulG
MAMGLAVLASILAAGLATAVDRSLSLQAAEKAAAQAGAAQAGAAQAGAEKPSGKVASQDGDGWVTIFDGKSMDGWKINESASSWKLTDGALVANGPRSHAFYVGAKEPFVNFEFKAEVMTKPNSNGGIFIHTTYQDEGWPKQGYESQVNNTFNRDPQKTGGLYNTVKVLEPAAKDNEYWTQHIIVKGNHVVVKINDKTVVDYTQPADKEGPVKLSAGTFALQAHDPGSTVYYRNIRVKRLP